MDRGSAIRSYRRHRLIDPMQHIMPTPITAPTDQPDPIRQRLLQAFETGHADGLRIGGIAAEELAQRFGSPLYAYDAQVLRNTLAEVRHALGPRVEVLFALKANPNAAVAQTLRLAGAGCEVASAGEILIALKAGFSGAQMQFAGPGKHGRDIELAFEHGISCLNIESHAEYEAILGMARARGIRPRPGVAIRINPRQGLNGSRMQMGGGSKKFGVDSEHVSALVERILADDGCAFRGLHVYAGTQSFDADAWLANARALCILANEIERDVRGASVATLNFGGGFGVALFKGDSQFDLEKAGAGLRALIAEDARPERRYFIEPGRYLAATCGVYLTRVLYAKESAGKRHLIVDGGMHHHAAAASLGSVIRRPYPFVLCRAVYEPADTEVTIGGVLCTPADELAANLALPAAHAGDLLAILGSGAYGLTFSNVLFLSHPTPAEVLLDHGNACVVRRRGNHEDALNGQVLPPDMERAG